MSETTGTKHRLRKIVLAVVLLAASFFLLCRTCLPRREPDPYRTAHYLCDECGEAFVARRQVPPVACPECGKRAGVHVTWLVCRECGRRFDGLRYRAVPGHEDEYFPKRASDPPPPKQIKLRDSAWVLPASKEGVALMRQSFVCPFCGEADARPVGPPALDKDE